MLMALSLVGLAFVTLARTERDTARNFLEMTAAQLQVEAELARVKAILLEDLYPDTSSAWRLLTHSHDYPDSADGWLFGLTGDGSAVLQASFGGTAPPDADNTGDGYNDSVWRRIPLSNRLVAHVATLVRDHGGLANVNIWGNTQDPLDGGHRSHQGLHPNELDLMRVLEFDRSQADQCDTYQRLFFGDPALGLSGRYGLGDTRRPGLTGLDDDGDDTDLNRPNYRDDNANGTIDEDGELIDEPDEFCYSNPDQSGGVTPADDLDRPFDMVDEWSLIRPVRDPANPVLSPLELLLAAKDPSDPFKTASLLGPYRRNLTTLSADPEWVGVGAADTTDRLRLRVDLNHDPPVQIETAFRQAGFAPWAARQMAVNIADYRDTDDDVTRHPDDPTICGHERQPYLNEVYFGLYADGPDTSNIRRGVAIELYNPYDAKLNVRNWQIRTEADTGAWTVTTIDAGAGPIDVPAGGYLVLVSADSGFNFTPDIADTDAVTLVLDAPDTGNSLRYPVAGRPYRVALVRAYAMNDVPNAANGELVVDDTVDELSQFWNDSDLPDTPAAAGGHTHRDFERQEAEANLFLTRTNGHSLGALNSVSDGLDHFRVKIPNRGPWTFFSVGDLGEVLNYTQNGSTPYTDDYVGMAAGNKEQNIKYDLSGDWYAGGPDNPNRRALDLFCIKRPDHDGLDNDGSGRRDHEDPANALVEAAWPKYGRLNINTASQEMLARALSNGPFSSTAATVLANRIVARRETEGPFTHIGDLFRGSNLADLLQDYALDGADNDGDGEDGEKDERDARFRYLANLVTTRSNVFTVYVTVEIRDRNGNLRASQKALALLDRSHAEMDVRFDGTTRVPYVTSPVIVRGFRWVSN